MEGIVEWAPLLFVIAGIGGGVGFGWWIQAQLAESRHAMRNEFHVQLSEVDRAREAVAREFSTYKQHVAETYMSKASGGMAIDRAVVEIKGLRTDLKEEMNKLGDRIERMENHVLDRRPA